MVKLLSIYTQKTRMNIALFSKFQGKKNITKTTFYLDFLINLSFVETICIGCI